MNQSTLMNRLVNQFLIATIFLSAPILLAGPETFDTSKEVLPPPPPTITDDQWHFNLGSPGGMASLSGEVGLQGGNVEVDVGFDQSMKLMDSLMSLRAEVTKVRFRANADVL